MRKRTALNCLVHETGLTYQEIADRAGLPLSHVSRMVGGRTIVAAVYVRPLSRGTGIPIDVLLTAIEESDASKVEGRKKSGEHVARIWAARRRNPAKKKTAKATQKSVDNTPTAL